MPDLSNGYESVASEFMARRLNSAVGVETVLAWSRALAPGAAILDLGCGHGVPISQALMEAGFMVYGVDASPTMAATFRELFPQASVAVEAVEESGFFDRTFDGVVAWGLMFLLSADAQSALIGKIALALKPAGRLLFTAPKQPCTWVDAMTGQPSRSLGAEAYKAALFGAGLTLVGAYQDEGDNYYFDASRS